MIVFEINWPLTYLDTSSSVDNNYDGSALDFIKNLIGKQSFYKVLAW